jgi:hypothetical protein
MSFIGKIFKKIGKAIGLFPEAPKLPALPPPPPPPPGRDDAAIALAADKKRTIEHKRKGRRALFTGPAAGVTDEANLGRPAATLGG